jgi:hypothetical protein
MEDILTGAIDTTRMRYDNLISSLQGYLDAVSANRAQLFPSEPEPEYETTPEPQASQSNVETVVVSDAPDSGADNTTEE